MNVFILSPNGIVQGLTVLVFNGDDGEVVFANLAGTIDLAKIGEIGDTLHVPGLDKMKKEGIPRARSKQAAEDDEEAKEESE